MKRNLTRIAITICLCIAATIADAQATTQVILSKDYDLPACIPSKIYKLTVDETDGNSYNLKVKGVKADSTTIDSFTVTLTTLNNYANLSAQLNYAINKINTGCSATPDNLSSLQQRMITDFKNIPNTAPLAGWLDFLPCYATMTPEYINSWNDADLIAKYNACVRSTRTYIVSAVNSFNRINRDSNIAYNKSIIRDTTKRITRDTVRVTLRDTVRNSARAIVLIRLRDTSVVRSDTTLRITLKDSLRAVYADTIGGQVPIANRQVDFESYLNRPVIDLRLSNTQPIPFVNSQAFNAKGKESFLQIISKDKVLWAMAGANNTPNLLYTYLLSQPPAGADKNARKALTESQKNIRQQIRELITLYYAYTRTVTFLPGSSIKFEGGLIEEMSVVCNVVDEPKPLLFTLSAPIPFSVLQDYNRVNKSMKYDKSTGLSTEKMNSSGKWLLRDADNKYQINVYDLLFYKPDNHNHEYDKSPADTVIYFDSKATESILYKEKNHDLVQAAFYTDLVGIDNTKPNGLVQIELWRGINVFSRRYGPDCTKSNWGFLTSITPKVVISKIENKLRQLNTSNWTDTSTGSLLHKSFARTVDLANYETFQAGFTSNLVMLAIPSFKTNIYWNTELAYGRVQMQDSNRTFQNHVISTTGTVNNYGANVVHWSSDITVKFLQDSRVGLSIMQKFNMLYSTSDLFSQVQSTNKYLQNLNSDGSAAKYFYGTTELYIYFNFSSYTKIFGRYRFNYQLGDVTANYHQAQLGFAFDIFGGLPTKSVITKSTTP